MSVLQNSERLSPIAAIISLAAARVQEASDRIKARQKENQVRAELMRYSDRELADIGLSRYQVETMDLSENA